MKKKLIVQKIIQSLTEQVELFTRAAQAARAEATDEQSRAENKYDTRGLEASYLARGQSRQVAELEQAILDYQKLLEADLESSVEIGIGNLIEMEAGKEKNWYFLGPSGGGIEVIHNRREVTVITPRSPLGEKIMGLGVEKANSQTIQHAGMEFRVLSVL